MEAVWVSRTVSDLRLPLDGLPLFFAFSLFS